MAEIVQATGACRADGPGPIKTARGQGRDHARRKRKMDGDDLTEEDELIDPRDPREEASPLDGAICHEAPIVSLKPRQCRFIAGEASASAVYCG